MRLPLLGKEYLTLGLDPLPHFGKVIAEVADAGFGAHGDTATYHQRVAFQVAGDPRHST